MRIIAGKHRGKKLAEFGGLSVRPTPDRVKESLFQILSERLEGARVLDLFAGSGALGIEALSRGAREAVFNDNSPESRAILQKNLRATGEKGRVYALDFRAALKSVEEKFDLIFADPPYKEEYFAEILSLIGERGLLAAGGLVVYETEREETVPEGWVQRDLRRYGRTRVVFLQRSEK